MELRRPYDWRLWLAVAAAALAGCDTKMGDGRSDSHTHDEDGGAITPGVMTTLAGIGTAGFAGDDGPASQAQLSSPIDVLVRASGEIVLIDYENHRIRSIDPTDGTIETMAGTGETTGPGAIFHPTGVAFGADGSFYVSAWEGHGIYLYLQDGTRSLVAGNGGDTCHPSDVAASALEASLSFPRSVGLQQDGTLLFSEQGCHRIRQISSDGDLGTLAGTGEAGYTGDDGSAVDATFRGFANLLDTPGFGFALSPEDPPDELYIADTANHVIREINLFTGQIETIAGTGEPGFEDGPLDRARLNSPTHVFASADHAIWIVDSGNHAIRRIDPLGTEMATVAGTGTPGYNGDDFPAAEAQLNNPGGVFVTDSGTVYIADTGNHRVRVFTYSQTP